MSVRRWVSITSVVLLAYLIQTTVVAGVDWPLIGPDLYFLVLLAWWLHLPVREGILLGFFAGLVLDLAPPVDGPVGKWALIFTVAAVLVSRLSITLETPLAHIGVMAGGSAVLVTAGYLFASILGEGLPSVASALTIIAVGAWNFVLGPWVLMVVRRTVRGTASIGVRR